MTRVILFLLAFSVCASTFAEASNDPNSYTGTDSERIAKAILGAASYGGTVRIGPRRPDAESSRDYWSLDSAILLPSKTTLVLENCVLKLSDQSRDNFIRSANSGVGIQHVEPSEQIHIIGVGNVRLVGADRPRATGDSGKRLGERTYGTDTGKPNESQTGDWRNIGVLLANVRDFSIENITIEQAHAWSVSLEKCSYGRISNIRFDSTESRTIDENSVKVLNVDGIDLRKGCHDITIENITGRTGDDIVALTAIGSRETLGGDLDSTQVCDYSLEDDPDIYNVTIRGVFGYSAGGHQIVRLLNASGIRIYRVTIDGVTDVSPEGVVDRATIRIGDSNPAWGGVTPLGDTFGIIITNVHSQSNAAILIAGSLVDSVITNVVNYNSKVEGPTFESGKDNVSNVRIEPFINVSASR